MEETLYFKYVPMNLSLRQIHPHPSYVTYEFASDLDSIVASVESIGLLVPLLVMNDGDDTYHVIDGHRRLEAAKRLELTSLYCVVRPHISNAEFAVLRYQLHSTVKPWTAQELSQQRKRMEASQT